MVRGRVAGMSAVLMLGLQACSGTSGAGSQGSVVERYVELLDNGDVSGAMALRCAEARIDVADEAQFASEVDRLRDALGGRLHAIDVREVDSPRLQPRTDAEAARNVRFRLRTDAGRSEEIHVVTVMEDGDELLCGYAAASGFEMHERLDDSDIPSAPIHVHDVRALADEAANAAGGSEATNGASAPELAGEASTKGWAVSWRRGEFGGGHISVWRFRDTAAATKVADALLSPKGMDGVELFSLDAVPEAVGVRYLASAWSWLQPPDHGLQIDEVVMVLDDVVVNVAVSPVSPSDGHEHVEAIVRAAVAAAAPDV